jgi:coenzyme F420-0:L-glutamate ligase/coenzyme F420-1:gamma-L-glutamate ligase
MITIFALAGFGEVTPGADLASLILGAARGEQTLVDGDIVVVTSKIVSKAEGRGVPAGERESAITAASTHTVARRGRTRIVRTHTGLTIAGAGVDNSNVDPQLVLLLPLDPDASAATLRHQLHQLTGLWLGVIVSDTAGRAWRIGQTDQAIGAAGVRVVADYAGQTDPYGNDLQVTAMALADELAAAADLVKTKLAGRPVAVVRGLAELVVDGAQRADDLVREPATDMFGFGAQEAVLVAALAATGQTNRYEDVVALEPGERAEVVVAGADLPGPAADLLRALLAVDLAAINTHRTTG